MEAINASAETSPAIQTLEFSIHINRAIRRGHWLLLESLAKTGHTYGNENRVIELIDLRRLDDPAMLPGSPLERKRIEGLARHVRYLVGSYRDSIVFIDSEFWLCTWDFEQHHTKPKRHFFLPQDWLHPTSLKLRTVNAQGTVLCPRNGEVAIIRYGLR